MSVRHLLTEHINYEPLPLAPFSLRLTLAAENAIRAAWERIRASETGMEILRNGGEDHVTIRLEAELEEVRSQGVIAEFSDDTFAMPVRSAQFMSYDGSHIKKSPDLVLRLKALRAGLPASLNLYDGIFIEAKLLTQTATLGDYGKDGILRFVNGEYAWAMSHCLMLAYVRTEQTLPEALTEHLDRNQQANMKAYGVISPPAGCPASRGSPRVHITKHARPWKYPIGTQPGGIEIRHLWLTAVK